jgi:hypothetical protein
MIKHIYFVLIVMLLASCSGGLEPVNTPNEVKSSFLNGTIHYLGGKGSWPSKDSAFAIRIVAFKNYPPGNIIDEITNGNAIFTLTPMPLFVDSSKFSIEISNAPIEYKYIVAALQYDSLSIFAQKAIGVYNTSGDFTKPSPILFEKGKTYNINIMVDFSKLPPQPF